MEQEHEDQLSEQAQGHKLREQAIERKVSSLEAEVRANMDAAASAAHARAQLHDQETKLAGLQCALLEHESRSEQERVKMTDELRARVDELSAARRRTHELQVQFDQADRREEQLLADGEGLRRERAKLTAQLQEARAKVALMRPAEESDRLQEELVQLRQRMEVEREHLNRQLKIVEDEHQDVACALRRAETKVRQHEEELAEREHKWQLEREETERSNQMAIAVLQKQFDDAEKEINSKRQAWRDREESLMRQIETSSARVESVSDELAQCQNARDEAKHRVLELRLEHQQREAASQADQKQRVEAGQEEEARRTAIVAQIQEDHKKQLVRLQASSKRTIQKVAHKRQELRQQCQELVRRVRQLQEEKALAVRVCEENKNAYELRLTGASIASRCCSTSNIPIASAALRLDSSPQSPSATHRRELRSIMERLEANTERFRSCQSSVDLANIAPSDAVA